MLPSPRLLCQVNDSHTFFFSEQFANASGRTQPIAFAGKGIMHPTFDWGRISTPQSALDNRQIVQPAGKGLGGSSLVRFCYVSV
jgi:hypothetical protein